MKLILRIGMTILPLILITLAFLIIKRNISSMKKLIVRWLQKSKVEKQIKASGIIPSFFNGNIIKEIFV